MAVVRQTASLATEAWTVLLKVIAYRDPARVAADRRDSHVLALAEIGLVPGHEFVVYDDLPTRRS